MYNKDIIFIGIIESDINKKTISIIKSILIKFDYEIIFINESKNILCLKNGNNILFIINIVPEDIECYKILGIKFDILVHNFIKKEEYYKGLLNEAFTDCKYYILNIDDTNWNLLPLDLLEGFVINYGYNRKSTLTVSSYNINGLTKANLYLQRRLETISQEKIDPFEFTIEISSKNKKDIYPVLSAAALNLILFNKELSIKSYKTIKM